MKFYKSEYDNGNLALFGIVDGGLEVLSVNLETLPENMFYFDSNNHNEVEEEVVGQLHLEKIGEKGSGFCNYTCYSIPYSLYNNMKKL